MKNLLLTLTALLLATHSFAGDGVIRRAGKPVPNQYIAVLEDDAPGRSEIAGELTHRFGARTRIVFAGFHGFSFEGTERAAQAISRDPHVAWVEENAIGELTQAANTTERPFPPGWAMDRGDQALPPLDGYGGPGCSTASGIRIYVVDTGVNDIDGTEFGTRLRDLYKVRSAWSYRDISSHGSAVASVAGGRRHGLARSAEMVNVKVSDTGGQSRTEWVIDSITRIDVDHYNRNRNNASPRAAVVNMSLYFSTPYFTEAQLSALDQAVQSSVRGCNATSMVSHTDLDGVTALREQCTSFNAAPAPYGLTYVVGAGNNNSNVIDGSPARLGNDSIGTITVGATMMRDEWMTDWRAVWGTNSASNYGPEIDIWAPGADVPVQRHKYDPDAPGAVTRKEGGTSIASPFVAGQVARLAATYTSYTSQQLESQLKSGATSGYPDMSPVVRDIPGGLFIRYAPGKCRPV